MPPFWMSEPERMAIPPKFWAAEATPAAARAATTVLENMFAVVGKLNEGVRGCVVMIEVLRAGCWMLFYDRRCCCIYVLLERLEFLTPLSA